MTHPMTDQLLSPPLVVRDLGRMAYSAAWDFQRDLVARRFEGQEEDTLLFVEHDPVLTAGRGSQKGGEQEGPLPFELFEVERGGEMTYHGPGQIVVYPIVHLAEDARDLHRWMRCLEQACITAMAGFGLDCFRKEGATGVWTADGLRKVASIGVAARRWVTWHGMAVNHRTDLEAFQSIRPCGFSPEVMTSMEAELGEDCPSREMVVSALSSTLAEDLASFRFGGLRHVES